jgi:glycosyltransferase 2 family protein
VLNRRTAVLVGKALVSIGLLYILLRAISWSSLKEALSGASLGWVILAILAGLLQFVVSTWRWQLLLRSLDTQPPSLAVLMRYYLIGGLFNNFAPANLAGDAALSHWHESMKTGWQRQAAWSLRGS